MQRLLAIEWDERQARAAVGSVRAGGLVIEQLLSVELQSEEAEPNTATIGAQIAESLAGRNLGRLEALVAVARGSLELKYLTLPPAPDDELPDLVRFQSLREFTALGENWPLDFIPIAGGGSEPRRVLAAALAPQIEQQVRGVCQLMQVEPRRLVLRPCGAASLLRRQRAGAVDVCLLVDPLGEEVDLTVLDGPTVVFMRTARLPEEFTSAEGARALVNEVRRTMAAVQNTLAGRKVESIWLCGAASETAPLVDEMGRELSLSCNAFDPLSGLQLDGKLRRALPANPARFAPLLGMLLDEAEGAAPAIDFFHPRRRPEAPRRTGRLLRIAAAAAALLLLTLGGGWWYLHSLDGQIGSLAEQSKRLDAEVARAAVQVKSAGEVDKWQAAAGVTWLDELVLLSKRFPPAKEAMLTNLQVTTSGTTGPKLALSGLAASAGVIQAAEARPRDGRHVVFPGVIQQDDRNKKYPWSFNSTITVKPGTKQDYREPPGAGSASPPPRKEAR